MPLYDFSCTNSKCNHTFDELVKLKDFDTAVVKCPKCGTVAKRRMSAQRATSTSWKYWRL
jgi:putative FmdB family regulatory protein